MFQFEQQEANTPSSTSELVSWRNCINFLKKNAQKNAWANNDWLKEICQETAGKHDFQTFKSSKRVLLQLECNITSSPAPKIFSVPGRSNRQDGREEWSRGTSHWSTKTDPCPRLRGVGTWQLHPPGHWGSASGFVKKNTRCPRSGLNWRAAEGSAFTKGVFEEHSRQPLFWNEFKLVRSSERQGQDWRTGCCSIQRFWTRSNWSNHQDQGRWSE